MALLFLQYLAKSLLADDLSNAFGRAEQMVRDWKPSSSSGSSSDHTRSYREDSRSTEASEFEQWLAEKKERDRLEREKREKERQRVQKNLVELNTKLSAASVARPAEVNSPFSSPAVDAATINARTQLIRSLIRITNTPGADPNNRSETDRELALQNATVVRDVMAHGEQPPFEALWNFYRYSRPIAFGLLPNENKCAITMSMTLGIQPRADERSLQSIGNKALVASVVGPMKAILTSRVRDTDIAGRYYINAQQLADRLRTEWGEPKYLEGKEARAYISGKKGVIFLQHADWRRTGRTGNHLDLWNSDHLAASARTSFDSAEKVWFWGFTK